MRWLNSFHSCMKLLSTVFIYTIFIIMILLFCLEADKHAVKTKRQYYNRCIQLENQRPKHRIDPFEKETE